MNRGKTSTFCFETPVWDYFSRGFTNGVFDVIHVGHVRHLLECKLHCDFLTVAINSDDSVDKGPSRPKFNQDQRKEMLYAFKVVDQVIVFDKKTACDAIKETVPDVYFKGTEERTSLPEEPTLKELGIPIHYTSPKSASSSDLVCCNTCWHGPWSCDDASECDGPEYKPRGKFGYLLWHMKPATL